MATQLGLAAHELFKVKVWLGLQGIKLDPLDQLLEKFDRDQPRDDDGKWTSGGGAGSRTS